MGYGFVGTVLAGIGITHYLALLADADVEASSAANSAALSVPMDQLAGETQVALPEEAEIAEELAATQQHSGDDVVGELAHATAEHGPGFPFSFHPTLMSRKMAGNFVRFLYDKSARDDHYEYWNQVPSPLLASPSSFLRCCHSALMTTCRSPPPSHARTHAGVLRVVLPVPNAGHLRRSHLGPRSRSLGSLQGLAERPPAATAHAATRRGNPPPPVHLACARVPVVWFHEVSDGKCCHSCCSS
jgi:hypothetical protein